MTRTKKIPPGWALITANTRPSDLVQATGTINRTSRPDDGATGPAVSGQLISTRLAIGYLALVILSGRGVVARARKTTNNQVQADRFLCVLRTVSPAAACGRPGSRGASR